MASKSGVERLLSDKYRLASKDVAAIMSAHGKEVCNLVFKGKTDEDIAGYLLAVWKGDGDNMVTDDGVHV